MLSLAALEASVKLDKESLPILTGFSRYVNVICDIIVSHFPENLGFFRDFLLVFFLKHDGGTREREFLSNSPTPPRVGCFCTEEFIARAFSE